jgi:hypothetical protein
MASQEGNKSRKWRQGDRREDGFVFWGYQWRTLQDGTRKRYLVFRSPEGFVKTRRKLTLTKRAAYKKNPEQRRNEGRQRYAADLELSRKRNRAYYAANAEKERAKQRKYYKANAAKVREKRRQKYKENWEKERESNRRWLKENREQRARYQKKRRAENIEVLLAHRVRERLRAFIERRSRADGTQKLIGCTWPHLVRHIESQFTKSMSWASPDSFHIDHIVPLALFKLAGQEELKLACNWRNLRPICPRENSRKGARITKRGLIIARKLGGDAFARKVAERARSQRSKKQDSG